MLSKKLSFLFQSKLLLLCLSFGNLTQAQVLPENSFINSNLINKSQFSEILETLFSERSNELEVINVIDAKASSEVSCSDNSINILSENAIQLAAAHITLSDYLQLSEIQVSFAEKSSDNGVDLAFFAQNIKRILQFSQLSFTRNSTNCHPACAYLSKAKRCSTRYLEYCGGCPECRE